MLYKYIVKEVPPYPLRFDSSCNAKILKDFKEILKDKGVGLFGKMRG